MDTIDSLFTNPHVMIYWTGQWELANLDLHLSQSIPLYVYDVAGGRVEALPLDPGRRGSTSRSRSRDSQPLTDCEAFGHLGYTYCARCGQTLQPHVYTH